MTDNAAKDDRTSEAWRRTFDRSAESRHRLAAIVIGDPKPVGSLRELDERDLHGRFVFELAETAAGIASDHLEAWRALRQEAHCQPAWAHVTLLRGALEASCLCRWLVDSSVNSNVRVRRGVKAQLDDWHQRGLWEGDWGLGKKRAVGTFRSGMERYEELLGAVGPIATDEERKNTANAFKMEPLIDICGHYALGAAKVRGNGLYRLLSAFAHAKQWSLIGGMFEVEDPRALGQMPGPRLVTANEDLAFVLTACVVRTFTSAVQDLERYVESGRGARANATEASRSRGRRRGR